MSGVLTGRLVALTTHGPAAPIRVRFELTNHGGVDLLVLKWFTPLEGLNSVRWRHSDFSGRRLERFP